MELLDFKSTHGTFVNGKKVEPFVRTCECFENRNT